MITWNCGDGANQQHKVEGLGQDRYKLTAQQNGSVVDVDGQSSDDGANIHQWDWWGGGNQKW